MYVFLFVLTLILKITISSYFILTQLQHFCKDLERNRHGAAAAAPELSDRGLHRVSIFRRLFGLEAGWRHEAADLRA
jgi:hypothetical protein